MRMFVDIYSMAPGNGDAVVGGSTRPNSSKSTGLGRKVIRDVGRLVISTIGVDLPTEILSLAPHGGYLVRRPICALSAGMKQPICAM